MKKLICSLLIATLCCTAFAQKEVTLKIDPTKEHQTIHSFGASDCWRAQYLGGWPDAKREQMADWLFSTELDKKGNPKGIGLSLWRFNIGSGSHEAGDNSGVISDWRRTECFLDENGNWDFTKQAGQRWFIEAAKKRGVQYTLGFSITAPYFMTINGMTRADKENPYANLKETEYKNYADFMVRVCKELGIDYLSPINEPQWDWIVTRQEGMQATNRECSRLMFYIDEAIEEQGAEVKVAFGEAADIRYLYRGQTDRPLRDNQINEIFTKDGVHSIAELKHIAPVVTGHSYWSTWPLDTLITTRTELKEAIKERLPEEYSYWQTEYCPMEQNEDNPNGGGGRDLGMQTALYIARIIHADLAFSDATSWQSWTAFSDDNYKDGLIFVSDDFSTDTDRSRKSTKSETCKTDGVFTDSKYMWALGNYSRFVRPGMVRIDVDNSIGEAIDECKSVMASAYKDPKTGEIVVVAINFAEQSSKINLEADGIKKAKVYETSEKNNLNYLGYKKLSEYSLPARSITTFVCSK